MKVAQTVMLYIIMFVVLVFWFWALLMLHDLQRSLADIHTQTQIDCLVHRDNADVAKLCRDRRLP